MTLGYFGVSLTRPLTPHDVSVLWQSQNRTQQCCRMGRSLVDFGVPVLQMLWICTCCIPKQDTVMGWADPG